LVGPFAFQPNNDTRAFEYPWAFEALGVSKGLHVLEIGGGLSGLQFVLARSGCKVVNVDPGEEAAGLAWPLDASVFARLNRCFRTDVVLRECFIEEAQLPDASFDRVVSISVVEHIPHEDLLTLLEHVSRVLKPGGLFVMTVDLFLDLEPFTTERSNRFGRNVSLEWLIRESGLELLRGTRAELYGHEEFDPERIISRKDQYFVGTRWPTMVQTVVLRKTSPG
jgi:SAM-dependent methyltransferase